MRPHPPLQSAEGDGAAPSGRERLADGFRFLKGRRVLQSTFIVDLTAMIFGMPRRSSCGGARLPHSVSRGTG
jgi:hypothetical protein